MSEYSNFFKSQTIGDVEKYTDASQPHKELITVKPTNTVEEVLKLLNDNTIVSVPVIDENLKPGELNKNGTPFLGIVSVIDLITAFAFQPVFSTYDTDSGLNEIKEETFSTITEAQRRVLNAPVSKYLGLSDETKTLWCFDEKDPVNKLLDVFSVGVHRILVSHKSATTPYWSFLSQTDVLRYLKVQSYRRQSQVGEIFLSRLTDLKLVGNNSSGGEEKKIKTIAENSSAITGFRQMISNNELSALPIVNDKGQLMGTLSSSDFRGIGLDNFKNSLLPVNRFIVLSRGGKKQHQLTVRSDEVLSSVVDKLLLRGVHRVWVVDQDNKPIEVVSLTDIIRTFSIYAPTE